MTGRGLRITTAQLAIVAGLALTACAQNARRSDVTTTTGVPSAEVSTTSTHAPPPPLEVPMYSVQKGDTIGRIATKMGVEAQMVIDANGLTNPDKIKIGQKLRVPAGGRVPDGATSATPTTLAG